MSARVQSRLRTAGAAALALLVALAIATWLASIAAPRVAHADVTGAAPALVEAAGSPPAPAPTIDDVATPWRRGDYLGAGLVAMFLVLTAALKADRKRALYYTAGLAALGGLVELVMRGQTPNVSMLVGAAAVGVALILRSPIPPRTERSPESGIVSLLPALALALLAVVGGALAWGCAPVAKQTRATAGHVVDCTGEAIEAQATIIGPRVQASIDAHTDETGVDWPAVGRDLAVMVRELGVEAVGCAATRTVDDLFQRRSLVAIDVTGWERVRAGVFEGRTFETRP